MLRIVSMSEDTELDDYDEERGRELFEQAMEKAKKVFEEYKRKSEPDYEGSI